MKKSIYLCMMAFFLASVSCAQPFTVALRAYLEGPFNGLTMDTLLNSNHYLPLSQPYNTAPWNYSGTESVTAIPNVYIVDWVLVELRETAGDASTAYKDNVIATQAGFILNTGNIVSTDGISPMQLNCTLTYKLYAVVYHRNHLAILSGNELLWSGGYITYDFTLDAGQAYGGANAQKELAPGVWGMVAGDGDANGQVNNADKNDVWKPTSGSSGYKAGDFTLNGQVDNVDKNDYWKVNSGRSSQVVGVWSCGKAIADNRDGKVYSTVLIGTQCWMKQNVNIGQMINGGNNQTNNGIIEKYCYDNDPANCDVYGGLYTWDEMMQYVTTPGVQGICPLTWHVPTDAEWCVLEQYVDPTISCNDTLMRGTDGGGKLKEAGTVHWSPPNTGATNSSGFTALPGGYQHPGGFYNDLTLSGFFWSSTENNTDAWYRTLWYNEKKIGRWCSDKDPGESVRCLKDMNLPPNQPANPNPPDGAVNQPVNLFLSWSCTDPENDPLTYDVYLSSYTPPLQVAAGLTDTTYYTGILDPSQFYFWKIVAHDDHGNSTEGPVWMFTTGAPWSCGSEITDARDGRIYPTVQIGLQCWLAKNMNLGDMIPNTSNQTNNALFEKYCYNNDPAYCEEYGGLYQWNEMMQYVTTPGTQGICPPTAGWHLPTEAEWCILEQYVDPTVSCYATGWRGTDGGGKLKEAGTAHWAPPNAGATNSSGFTALPAGNRHYGGVFNYLTTYATFWTSNESGANVGWFRDLSNIQAKISRNALNKGYGFSVRCVTVGNLPPGQPANPTPPDSTTNVQNNLPISWTCSDPENDPLTYDVFFSTTLPPTQVVTGQTATTYNPGNLEYGMAYFWKIVAHDDHGSTTEGPVWMFVTGPSWVCGEMLVDIRDGKPYPTVLIGSQCWLAKDMNIGTMIPVANNQSNNGVMEKYCYNNDPANCDMYGGLYQWDEMMQYTNTPGAQGICLPTPGWHIPTDAEWCTLEQYVDPTIVCSDTSLRGADGGGKLKEAGTVHWAPPNTGATNSSGFTALPGGYCSYNIIFYALTLNSFMWSSNESGEKAWYRVLGCNHALVGRYRYYKNSGMSVRCMKEINNPPNQPANPNPPDGAVNQPVNLFLSWSCTDPENDPLTYDVYLSSYTPPLQVAAGLTDTTYYTGILDPSQFYFWKIVAHDDHGNSTEGPVWMFTTGAPWSCGSEITDARDGRIYPTVQIGLQCWLAKNMNLGDMIPNTSNQTNNALFEKYCYNNDPAYCEEYGGLYQWNEMMQYVTTPGAQGICPEGWHVPDRGEYTTLSVFLGGDGFAGGALKEIGTVHWAPPNTGATNSSGFTGLPGGRRDATYFTFSQINTNANLWTSTLTGYGGWLRWLRYDIAAFYETIQSAGEGYSVRCVKD